MDLMVQAYHLGRAACWHGLRMVEDHRFGCLMRSAGLIRCLMLMINWKRGWRDAARCR